MHVNVKDFVEKRVNLLLTNTIFTNRFRHRWNCRASTGMITKGKRKVGLQLDLYFRMLASCIISS